MRHQCGKSRLMPSPSASISFMRHLWWQFVWQVETLLGVIAWFPQLVFPPAIGPLALLFFLELGWWQILARMKELIHVAAWDETHWSLINDGETISFSPSSSFGSCSPANHFSSLPSCCNEHICLPEEAQHKLWKSGTAQNDVWATLYWIYRVRVRVRVRVR